MHVLQLIVIYSIINKVKGNEADCLSESGAYSTQTIIKSEYEYYKILVLRFIKPICQLRRSQMIWKKDGIEFKREKQPRKDIIRSLLEFDSLSKKHSGNYTLVFSNSKFTYTYQVELVVNSGSFQLKQIRENMLPRNSNNIVKGRLYWMPKMIDIAKTETVASLIEYSIGCWFCSTDKVNMDIAKWYKFRSSAQLFETKDIYVNSRTNIMTTEIAFDNDHRIPRDFQGHCYKTMLNFEPFLSTDSGEYECKIGDHLRTNFTTLAELTNFVVDSDTNGDYISQDLSENSITFNDNETVCVGDRFEFKCISHVTMANLSLWSTDWNGRATIISRSEDGLSINLNMSYIGMADARRYTCGINARQGKHMFLSVQRCFTKVFQLVLWLSGVVVITLFVSTTILCNICLRQRKRFYLNNKIHSMTKIDAEIMHRNELYIPLIHDINWEVSRKNVSVSSEVLGSGEFGTVLRGRLRNKPVAVKVANRGGSEMLVQEITVLKELGHHQHVIQLLGVSSWNEPLMMILELADGGNLRQHLRDHNPLLSPSCEQIGMEQLISFVSQIASGMHYLASKHVIHRDLAARNCLLTTDMCVKLSDFGLTRVAMNYYHNEGQEVKAIAWVAPESISDNIFTSKSDVWSFGIVMWEVFELGACPYPSLSSSEIVEAVGQGIVNRQPALASDVIYGIMMRCWALEANDRPSFGDLSEYLDAVDVNEYL